MTKTKNFTEVESNQQAVYERAAYAQGMQWRREGFSMKGSRVWDVMNAGERAAFQRGYEAGA